MKCFKVFPVNREKALTVLFTRKGLGEKQRKILKPHDEQNVANKTVASSRNKAGSEQHPQTVVSRFCTTVAGTQQAIIHKLYFRCFALMCPSTSAPP